MTKEEKKEINECIRLLCIDIFNTKLKVKNKLIRLIQKQEERDNKNAIKERN